MSYRGRFAPSPTGLLHAGSLVAALASWLDAKAHNGTWLVRIEDVDKPRCSSAAAQAILGQLAACGMTSDEPVIWQSERSTQYQQALNALAKQNALYACRCSRSTVAQNLARMGIDVTRHQETPYPGTCRNLDLSFTQGHSIRWQPPGQPLQWHDRRLGAQVQNVSEAVGDFVLKRQDGLWAYQLAVVVDDGWQGITHVVRGADLADNTPRQIALQRALGLATPVYFHTPLVMGENGEKLSKQNGAKALTLDNPAQVMNALNQAAITLGLQTQPGEDLPAALAAWVRHWQTLTPA